MVVTPRGQRLNMELYQAGQVMRSPVACVYRVDSVARVARLLLEKGHGGFPVVNGEADAAFLGMVSRAELLLFLLQFHDGGLNAGDGGVYKPDAE